MLIGLFSSRKFLIPIGVLMSLGIVSRAIFFHLFTPLGINVLDDSGLQFFCVRHVVDVLGYNIHEQRFFTNTNFENTSIKNAI